MRVKCTCGNYETELKRKMIGGLEDTHMTIVASFLWLAQEMPSHVYGATDADADDGTDTPAASAGG